MIKGYHYKICRHQQENTGRLQKTLVVHKVKHLPAMRETWIQSLDQEDPLEKEMATHSSTRAWYIPWTEEPGTATVHGVTESRTQRSNFTVFHFPTSGTSGKEPACQCRRHKRHGFDPWVGKIPCRRAWQPTPVFLPGESHGQRSLEGYSP